MSAAIRRWETALVGSRQVTKKLEQERDLVQSFPSVSAKALSARLRVEFRDA